MTEPLDAVVLKSVPSTSIFQSDIFKGKVLFCTGGGSGICYGMVSSIMKHGASAAIFGRKADRLSAAAEALEKEAGNGTKCLATPGDVRKPEDLNAAVAKTIEKFGRIDFVICGAAGNFLASIDGLSPNAFATVIGIDTLGTFNTVKATLPALKKSHGSYVHITATLHHTGLPWQSAASAAKAAIETLSQALAVEMGPLGVRSNCIAPGIISGTEGADRLTPKGAEDMINERIPMQRPGYKDDIANMGIYLFSDAASYITGWVHVVDGGARNNPMILPYPLSSLDPHGLKDLVKGSKL